MLLSTEKMDKVSPKFFKNVVNEILESLPIIGELGSEVSYFVPEPRNFVEVTRLSEDIRKPWLKANLKEIYNLINNHTFLVNEPEKGESVTPCMDAYKAKIQSDGILDKFKLIIVVKGDLQSKYLIGDIWSPTASMRTLKYFLADAVKHMATVHNLDFIGAFLQAKVKNRVFLKLDSRYADYFP